MTIVKIVYKMRILIVTVLKGLSNSIKELLVVVFSKQKTVHVKHLEYPQPYLNCICCFLLKAI